MITDSGMYILYHFHPEQLLEDYTFQSRTGKMINIKVSDAELSYIQNLAKKYNVTISCFAEEYGLYIFFQLEQRESRHLFD